MSIETWRQDIRYAARSLRRSPALTGAMAITLIVGIGLNAGVFSIVSGIVLRPRIDNDPASFVEVIVSAPAGARKPGNEWNASTADFQAFAEQSRQFAHLAAWGVLSAATERDSEPQLTQLATCDFFKVYGLERAKLGRLFLPQDCAAPGGAPVAVLSEELWRREYSADPTLVGRAIELNRRPFTVVGIAPARFPGRLRGSGIWVPYTMDSVFLRGRELFRDPQTGWLTMEGRIKPGYSRAAASAALRAIGRSRGLQVWVTNGSFLEHPATRTQVLLASLLTMGTMALTLLLVCANVTMLLLSRAAARRYEIGVRLALGATPRRLLRMLLTESLLIAGVAGVFSTGLAYAIPTAFERMITQMPHYPMRPDWLVFAYMAGLTLLAGLAAGIAPAAEALNVDLVAALKRQSGFAGRGIARGRVRDWLIGIQVAMSLFLLTGAGMFGRAEYLLYRSQDAVRASRMWPLTGFTFFLGGVALVLAVAGIYGVASFAVSVRTKELGIRMAVGATKGDIVKCVLASGVAPLAFGIAVGIALAGSGGLLLARVLQKAALPMGTNNPWIYAAVALGLSIAAAGAMLRPALRAAQCDPAQALRSE